MGPNQWVETIWKGREKNTLQTHWQIDWNSQTFCTNAILSKIAHISIYSSEKLKRANQLTAYASRD